MRGATEVTNLSPTAQPLFSRTPSPSLGLKRNLWQAYQASQFHCWLGKKSETVDYMKTAHTSLYLTLPLSSLLVTYLAVDLGGLGPAFRVYSEQASFILSKCSYHCLSLGAAGADRMGSSFLSGLPPVEV